MTSLVSLELNEILAILTLVFVWPVLFLVNIIVFSSMMKPFRHCYEIRSNSLACVIWIPYVILLLIFLASFFIHFFPVVDAVVYLLIAIVNPLTFLIWTVIAYLVALANENGVDLYTKELVLEVQARLMALSIFLFIVVIVLVILLLPLKNM